MLTQIDVSRLPSYQWGREDARNEFKTLLAETDSVLQEKENLLKQASQEKDQQTLSMIELARLTRKKYLSGHKETPPQPSPYQGREQEGEGVLLFLS
ncbi:hypothetical protein [Thiothrix winogradskyi]|uniref:Uncharacterized protein n=1 Tax=Thiothrix winogradskyi TaxID=96472 RepID=A0ABY3SXN7_9GAMM|nr:hypothetical protein [Thiothrix winogradskyi]UJS24287.1 hypothetical protein L2Y54_20510 [Thiothrix winogradskyi]